MAKEKLTLAVQLAALIYFDSLTPAKRKDALAFEKLTEAEQDPYVKQADRCLAALDKLNLSAQPKVDAKKAAESDQQKIDALITIIKDFIKGLKTTKPNLFPCEELALRIAHPVVQPEVPEAEKK